ncbi:glycosyltransferase [Armatimonas rosea]|uniref:Cellulose synthase/poly-beta-1,6-N-acetylglucosamine synthase-like glycosyltransferase/peptidoglycan/xylan/chitin deacetylase (PgdA/CDA1 family)/spore germination protein YaaH n=1 Tax=Armatimonas rosea TaxID=685828 RepID=A0A7W9SVB9_ARMRO|nr:glycosyltransferase [Armatimonas rosea]MBB6052869.1 cellulose synthase/poly-beta-1,6-N-acetylglucosamine synthase-like glycosyltransferase/peptidoglycan/xylan/chitin deacetylase (PgdA/CDA1 family)/spore germination protein YaaH [Armatimonas rosea]
MSEPNRPIFYDPTQRRGVLLQRLLLLGGVLGATALAIFFASILSVPISHRVRLPVPKFLPDNPRRAAESDHAPLPEHTRLPLALPVGGEAPGKGEGVVGGFYVDWDEVSIASLRLHASELTHLFPGWLHLNDTGDGLRITDHDPADDEARALAQKYHLAVFPLVNNFSANVNDFEEGRLHQLLKSPSKRAKVAEALLKYVSEHHYAGINLDLETEREDDREGLAVFAQEVAARFHAQALQVSACTQVGEPEEAATIARPCDFVIPMIYDQHYASGTAGPIAPEPWAEHELAQFLKAVPANKTVLAIGNYAYDWVASKPGAKTLTFGEAMVTAQESHEGTDGVVTWDREQGNPHFSYEEDGSRHEVWLLDAATSYNFLSFARSKGVTGRALWYVGSEDPTLWSCFGRGKKPENAQALRTVRYGFELDFEGEGEVLDVATLPQTGERTITTDAKGTITDERFLSYPTSCVLRRSGKAAKTIALTFDDGPDPRWTPEVLDALKTAGVPATFFITGVNAQLYPELVRRAWDEGHDIGNHSFYHPNLALVGETRTRLELDATQRAIQAITGRSTTLFRPPYGVDSQPSTSEEVMPIAAAERLGYVTVAEGIDPRDWEKGSRKRTAAQLVESIERDAEAGAGSIVLLHDSGGDRSATVAALPELVRRLKAKGYRFVTVSQLLGQRRDAAFPPVQGRQRWLSIVDRAIFATSSGLGRILSAIFLFSLIAGALRLLLTALLALRHASQPAAVTAPDFHPLTSVVIAAYNEEKVIVRTVQALLASDYPNLEVLIVDDGSKDKTAELVQSTFGAEPRVRLIVKENGGKASALNLGIESAKGEILIGLDADTLFATDTVSKLVRHFSDPTVGAVAGNIQVGNIVNRLARWQALEYTTSQNFDRRAYAQLNAIPVVPGCVGAWRTEAVRQAGLYQTDTLAEDSDLTWRVRMAGWRLLCDNDARAFTEAPEKVSELLKQRFRWTFGTLQVLWKNRRACFNRQYGAFGMVVIPLLWVFQFLLPALAPAADLGVVLSAITGNLQAAGGYMVFFFLLELSAATLALQLDGGSQYSLLWELPIQRVAYRYLLFVVLLKTLRAALSGMRAGWGKLERRGSARIQRGK